MATDQPTSVVTTQTSTSTSISAVILAGSPSPTGVPVPTGTVEVVVAATVAPTYDTASSSDQRPAATPTTESEATVVPNSAAAPPSHETTVGQDEVTANQMGTSVALVATRAPLAPVGTAQSSTPFPEQTTIIAEDGQVVHLKVGEIFQFKPGSESGWTVRIGDERIIAPVPGARGSYKALAPGETTLVATSIPACRQTKPACMLPTVVLHIKIVVQ